MNIGQGHTNNAYTFNNNTSNEAFGDLLCNQQLTLPLEKDNALSLVRDRVGSKVGHSC